MTSLDVVSETKKLKKYLGQFKVPKIGEPVTGFWDTPQMLEVYMSGVKLGVTLGTIVWPLYSVDGLNLASEVGDGYKITSKEWLLEPTEVVYDYFHHCLIICEMMREGENYYILGFFLPKDGLYESEERHNDIARSGKLIERTVEVASASSKKGKKWTVLVYTDGTKSCNCPSWIFHNTENGGNCKHTLKVK